MYPSITSFLEPIISYLTYRVPSLLTPIKELWLFWWWLVLFLQRELT